MTQAEKSLLQLLNLRMQHQRPQDMVIVSLIGRLPFPNPQVILSDEDHVDALDFRCLARLNVEVAHAGQRIKTIAALVTTVWSANAKAVSVCNYLDKQTILFGSDGVVYNMLMPWELPT